MIAVIKDGTRSTKGEAGNTKGDGARSTKGDGTGNTKGDGTRRGASPTKAVIPQIVQSLKSMTTRQFGFNMWQRSYHDHIIRNEIEYHHIWQYIDKNPEKWIEDRYYIKQEDKLDNSVKK
jgi:hypothetical protein